MEYVGGEVPKVSIAIVVECSTHPNSIGKVEVSASLSIV